MSVFVFIFVFANVCLSLSLSLCMSVSVFVFVFVNMPWQVVTGRVQVGVKGDAELEEVVGTAKEEEVARAAVDVVAAET